MTLIEIMVVVAILGIIITVALPSLFAFIDSRRAVSALEAISSDLRWARSESIRANQTVRVSFTTGASWSYTVRRDPAGANTLIKTVSVADFPSSNITSASFSSGDATTEFDPVRGTAQNGTVAVSTSSNSGEVRLGILGRVRICGMGGYGSC